VRGDGDDERLGVGLLHTSKLTSSFAVATFVMVSCHLILEAGDVPGLTVVSLKRILPAHRIYNTRA
jgi:hypothetical protein